MSYEPVTVKKDSLSAVVSSSADSVKNDTIPPSGTSDAVDHRSATKLTIIPASSDGQLDTSALVVDVPLLQTSTPIPKGRVVRERTQANRQTPTRLSRPIYRQQETSGTQPTSRPPTVPKSLPTENTEVSDLERVLNRKR